MELFEEERTWRNKLPSAASSINPSEEVIRLGPRMGHFLVTSENWSSSNAAFELKWMGGDRLMRPPVATSTMKKSWELISMDFYASVSLHLFGFNLCLTLRS